MKINGIDYVDYQEADLRFIGWEHECIIIDRTKNHYLIPKTRLAELRKAQMKAKRKRANPKKENIKKNCGFAGMSGIGNKMTSIIWKQ